MNKKQTKVITTSGRRPFAYRKMGGSAELLVGLGVAWVDEIEKNRARIECAYASSPGASDLEFQEKREAVLEMLLRFPSAAFLPRNFSRFEFENFEVIEDVTILDREITHRGFRFSFEIDA